MPAFIYNVGVGEFIKVGGTCCSSNTKQLGSTLIETMLREVANFCDPEIKESWTQKGHQQVAYTHAFCDVYNYSTICNSLYVLLYNIHASFVVDLRL